MAQIPIYIRNTFEPAHPGTRIFLPPAKGQLVRENCVCGFSTVDNISLLNLEGTGMIGVPGVAHRLFGALKVANVNVMFIAQASSEHSICCAMRDTYTAAAKRAIEEAFFYELKQGIISQVREINNCSIIAAVGESMSNMPGVSGLFFGALGGAQVNVLSVAQGCDERNISAVVYMRDAAKALRAVHAAFWLSALEINICIVGAGRVGSAVIQTILDQSSILERRFGLNIKLRGVANSSHMLTGTDLSQMMRSKLNAFLPVPSSEAVPSPPVASPLSSQVDTHARTRTHRYACTHKHRHIVSLSLSLDLMTCLWQSALKRTHSNVSLEDVVAIMGEEHDHRVPTDLAALLESVNSGDTSHAIVVDATNSEEVAALHPQWLLAGAHVVTANKRGLSSSLPLYNSIMSTAQEKKRMYMSEVSASHTPRRIIMSQQPSLRHVSIPIPISIPCASNVIVICAALHSF